MNIEIADRLLKLRKENGYSQEELADKLGLSRQAISKWERAESSPDTDNLIMLAKLYDMSLDELLNTDEPTEEIRQRVEEKNGKAEGITLVDDEGSEVTFNKGKVHLKDGNTGEEKDTTIKEMIKKKPNPVVTALDTLFFILTIIAFLVLGFTLECWHIAWILFVLYPVECTIFEAIFSTHRLTTLAYPLIVTAVFCYYGMTKMLWHPLWVLFLTVPVYYIIADLFDIYVFKTKEKDESDCCKK